MARRTARRRALASPEANRDPLTRSRLRLFGVALICLKVALVPLSFDFAADVPFTVMKGLVSHALAYVLAGVIVGLFVMYGERVFVRSWLHVPVVAFAAAACIATVFAANTQLALYGTHVRMLGLGTIADGVLLYFAIVLLVRTGREGLAVVASGLGASALVLAYEAVQLAGKDPLIWNSDSSVRPFSTLGQPTTLAEYLVVLALGVAAVGLLSARLRVVARALLLGYAGVLVAGVVVTQTRAALIGLVSGAAVLVLLTWVAHPSRRARLASAVGAVMASAALVLLLLFTPLGGRILSTVEVGGPDTADEQGGVRLEQSADVRLGLYRIALAMVQERPIAGYGPDNFVVGVPRYRTPDEAFEVQQSAATSAHSWLAQLAATSGVLGLAAFVAIGAAALLQVFRSGFRPMAWGCAAMLAAFLGAALTTVDDLSTSWLFWASVGGIALLTRNDAGEPPPDARVRREPSVPLLSPRNVGASLCVLVALALAASSWHALDASHLSQRAVQARLSGQYARAISLSLGATNSDAGRAEYWQGLGLGYVGAQRFGDAVTAFQRASAILPHDVRYLGEVARAYAVLAQRGDSAAGIRAREAADRGVQIDPNNPQAQVTRAVVLQVTGDLAEALTSVDRALELDQSNNREIYLTKTQVLEALGRPADAIAAARYGLTRIPDPRNQVALRIELARALAANGQPMDALTEIDAVLAIQPNQPTALALRAQIQAGLTR